MEVNPLSKADRAKARAAMHNLSVAREKVMLAKAAGIPVGEEEARVEHLHGVMSQLLRVYDKDHPTVPNE